MCQFILFKKVVIIIEKIQAKVYHDGSHYVFVTPQKKKILRRAPVQRRSEEEILFDGVFEKIDKPVLLAGEGEVEINFDLQGAKNAIAENLFASKETQIALVLPFIENYDYAKAFVEFARKRAWQSYRKRLDSIVKKIGVNQFNFFCTFTYDDEKHTEQSFRKKLSNCLNLLASRKGWKYIGVWERSPSLNRLHVHALMFIPEGTMPGELIEMTQYSTARHKQFTNIRNTYFNDKFGMSDFQRIEDNAADIDNMVGYILKYICKSGNKLFISRGLPSYKEVEIKIDDVAFSFGEYGQYNVVFDDAVKGG